MEGETAHKLPEVPSDQESEGADGAAETEPLYLPTQGRGKAVRNFVPPERLIEHFTLSRQKFARAMVAGSLAACFRLFNELMMGRYKGKELLDAIRLIEKMWGLPKFTKEELATAKQRGGWYKALKARGWDVDGMLDLLKELPDGNG